MRAAPRAHCSVGMSRTDVLMIIFTMLILVCLLVVAAAWWKKGSDRSATLMNIRNCQQAMRGHQGMKQLNTGDPFTRRDLERYMKFPEDIAAFNGMIRFNPGAEKVTPCLPAHPASGSNLWLKIEAPNTVNYVGQYGFNNPSDFEGW